MIIVKSISKHFKENVLFKDLSFLIKKGEKVCITADSGKGKSTLLRMILGLETLDEGEIIIENKILSSKNILEIRKQIAWLPQDLALNIDTADKLIELLRINKSTFISYLNKLNIDKSYLTQNFYSLSGGQKQRVLLAACLSLEKSILFLDEPTSALDKTSIQLLINTIWNKKELTVVSASHNKEWVDACSKIVKI